MTPTTTRWPTVSLSLATVLLCMRLSAIEVEQPPEDDSFHAKAKAIIDKMDQVHDHLRADRTDLTVQIKGKEIEDELDKLIEEWEEKAKQPKDGKAPLKDSHLVHAARSDDDCWYVYVPVNWNPSLAEAMRREIVQRYAPDVPIKWQRRIAAYFISIVCEEAEWYKYHPEKFHEKSLKR